MPKFTRGGYTQFKPEHLINFKGIDFNEVSLLSRKDRERHIIFQSQCGPAITAYIGSTPVAIFGIGFIWKGVGEAWAMFSEQSKRYPIAMTKGASTFFDIVEILFALHRIQITVRSDDERAVAWAKHLRFVSEGLMHEFSADKKDCFMMRRN